VHLDLFTEGVPLWRFRIAAIAPSAQGRLSVSDDPKIASFALHTSDAWETVNGLSVGNGGFNA
jgi:hypothetical protein